MLSTVGGITILGEAKYFKIQQAGSDRDWCRFEGLFDKIRFGDLSGTVFLPT